MLNEKTQMAIEELTAVIPPPASPVATGTPEGGKPIEELLGVELPPDFREYTAVYGAGMLAGWIGLYNPFTETAWGLQENVKSEVDTIHILEEDIELEMPHPIWPEQPGMLPCGHDAGGGLLLYHTEGRPEEGPVYYTQPRDYQSYECFEMPITTFLAKLCQGEIPGRGQGSRELMFEPFDK